MSEQLYGPKIFVGRQEQIELFEQMLQQPQAQWILNLWGRGGIGKTQLLHRFIDIARQRPGVLVTAELIDLYWTAHQRELGILESIARQLAPEQFAPFWAALSDYKELLLPDRPAPDPLQHRELEENALKAFFESYQNLTANAIVIIFDTAETAADATRRFWKEMLSRFKDAHSQTLIIIAGREPIVELGKQVVAPVELAGFSAQEIGDYFEQQGIDETFFKQRGIDVPSEIWQRVAELTEGRPVLVALTADWLKFGNAPQDLTAYESPQEFEPQLVRRIQQLEYPENQVILDMAHFYRRFDPEILAWTLGKSLESPEDIKFVNSLADSLSRFSFVKYRPPFDGQPASCTLRDEMRDMVNKYVWDQVLDPLGEQRRAMNQRAVEYYVLRIEWETDPIEKQNLAVERLFYWVEADPDQAFEYSRQLFGQALSRYDADFMEAINREIDRKAKSLALAQKLEIGFRKAIALHRREKYPEAIEMMKTVIEDADCPLELQANGRAYLVEFYADSGEPTEAIHIGLESQELCEKFLASLDTTAPERNTVLLALGTLCNNIGYAYRSQSKLNETIDYYNKAIDYFSQVNEADLQIARTLNNLGYVFHRLGRDQEALTKCDDALKIRLKLGNSYELGLSYNVLGAIYTDQLNIEAAKTFFERAKNAFQQAKSERGLALTFVAYGRFLRQLGYYLETFEGQPHNPERPEYQEAGKMLDRAIVILRAKSDEPNLSEALNEKGTLLRDLKRWEEAIRYYQESMDLARQVQNKYREIDNLQDIAITYNLAGNREKALEYAQLASKQAWGNNAYYLYARAERTRGEVLFTQQRYDDAFEAVANACIYILRPDPKALGHSSNKKSKVYEQFKEWARGLLFRLPEAERIKYTSKLVERWEKEELEGKRLKDLF